jgi:hypothetical protein
VRYVSELGLFYAWFAYLFLVVARGFNSAGWAGLVLSGAIAGWAIEALIIPLAYEAPPISFFWPSIGWHAVVDVILGWALLRWMMRRWPVWRQLVAFAGLGGVWALWAGLFWAEDPALVLPGVAGFASFTGVVGAIWLLGMVLADHPIARFRPTTGDALVALFTALPTGIAMGVSFGVWGLALGGFASLTLWALRRGCAGEGFEDRHLAAAPPSVSYLATLAMPAAAALCFTLLPAEMDQGLSFLITIPLLAIGTFLWAAAIIRLGLRSGPGRE